MIYLDAAATTPVLRSSLEAAWPYLSGSFGNPSSVHELGSSAARALADARAGIAAWLGCRPGELVFTGGGTEGANLAIKGLALGDLQAAQPRGRRILTTRIEHEAVLEAVDYLRRLHGFAVDLLETDARGRVSPEALRDALRPGTALVTIGYANNEIGTVQPVAELAAVAHAAGALFHSDAVQAAASEPMDVAALGVDALSFSGHKLGAPKGSGAVYLRGGLPVEPLLHGGGQERGRRSGTENVAWAVALAAAVEARRAVPPLREEPQGAARERIRDGFVARVLTGAPGSELTGDPARRLPGHASFVIPGVNGETVLLELERRGVVASSGSACAAGSPEVSHVLSTLGYPEDTARTALRFSWTDEVDGAQLTAAADALAAAVAVVRGL